MNLTSILSQCIYSKIPIISPGLIFVQKAVLAGLLLGELIVGGAYYLEEILCFKMVWAWQ